MKRRSFLGAALGSIFVDKKALASEVSKSFSATKVLKNINYGSFGNLASVATGAIDPTTENHVDNGVELKESPNPFYNFKARDWARYLLDEKTEMPAEMIELNWLRARENSGDAYADINSFKSVSPAYKRLMKIDKSAETRNMELEMKLRKSMLAEAMEEQAKWWSPFSNYLRWH